MEINRILFGQLNNEKVSKSFDDLDINKDGVISEKDISATENIPLKSAIASVLNSVDTDDNIELVENGTNITAKAGSSAEKSGSSSRQKSTTGLPMTDVNTFEEDVLNSSGTVFVYIGNQYRETNNSFGKCEKNAAANLATIQKKANVYHLDAINNDLVNKLRSQAGISSMYSNCILKFVDGKLVETISQSDALNIDKLLSKAEGEPSEMPDIDEPFDENPDAPRNSYGNKTTNTANFKNDVLNSTGTVYVTIGNLNTCTYCKELQAAIQQNAQTLNALATVYDLSTDTDKDLCWQIYRDLGGGDGSKAMPLPQVAKFVDGKFVQLMPKTIAEDQVAYMIKLAEGSAKKDKDGIAQTNSSTFNDDVKNSKGTTYVMITSASGCQYCNILHNQLKDVWSELKDKFGFYELTANSGADSDLCWQLFRQGGGIGDSMPLPQIAKFVDGEFVELLSNTRDYGKGLDNATIKEMIAKAEGEPENNALSSDGVSSDSDTVDATDETDNTDVYKQEKDIQENNLEKLQNELESISVEKGFKEIQKNKVKNELRIKEEKCKEIEEKIKNAGENEDTSILKSQLETLQGSISTLKNTLKLIEADLNNITNNYAQKVSAIKTQKQSIEALDAKISK